MQTENTVSVRKKISEEIDKIIAKSNRILVLSHFSPDPDSLGSALFCFGTIRAKYPNKDVHVFVEGTMAKEARRLKYSEEIGNGNLYTELQDYKPDLIISCDGQNWDRFSRIEGGKARDFVTLNSISTITFDHHFDGFTDKYDIYYNTGTTSTCELVYDVFITDLQYPFFDRSDELILLGIIGDTNRFRYKNPNHRKTFKIVSDIIDRGTDIEYVQLLSDYVTRDQLKVISHLIENYSYGEDYNYSFISEEFYRENVENQLTDDEYSSACHHFMDHFLRIVEPNKWGFILAPKLYPDGKIIYKGSFRTMSDIIDTTVFSKKLNGGGHKCASGFVVEASKLQVALEKVISVIEENRDIAYKTA